MKKWLLSIIAIIVILIGGVFVMKSIFTGEEIEENKTHVNRINVKKEERRMVKFVDSNYEGINKIKFISFDEIESTGTWDSVAIINETYHVRFSLYGKNGEITMSQLLSRNKEKKQLLKKSTPTSSNISNISISYFGENNDNWKR